MDSKQGVVVVAAVVVTCCMTLSLSSAVDTSEAGIGDVDVTVTCSSGHVIVERQKLDEFRHKFTFVPSLALTHDVSVTFNKQQVVGTRHCSVR